MHSKKKYEIYNKKLNKHEIFETYEYCAGSFLQWMLIMKGWKMKDCIIQVLEEDK